MTKNISFFTCFKPTILFQKWFNKHKIKGFQPKNNVATSDLLIIQCLRIKKTDKRIEMADKRNG
jgi:hypothetical protein